MAVQVENVAPARDVIKPGKAPGATFGTADRVHRDDDLALGQRAN